MVCVYSTMYHVTLGFGFYLKQNIFLFFLIFFFGGGGGAILDDVSLVLSTPNHSSCMTMMLSI